MESFYALALIAGILVAFVLQVLTAACNSFKAEIPPDVDQPSKLRLYHCIYTLMEILAKNLESLGIFEEHILIRLIGDGLPACRDSKLFIKDLHFDEVPVRIYLPRLPSASKQREVIFFHGGCGMFGSISYHLFPERKYPAQTLDCLTATVHFLKTAENYRVDPDSITVCGDSAGGTFTASVCQELVNIRVTPKIHAQVRIYPLLQALNFNLPSHQKNAFIAFLSQECTVCFILKYLNKDCSMNEAILAGSHVPKSMNLKYRKWINPDLITKIFKLGYKPPLPTSFLPQVHEEMNCLRQDFPTVSRRCWVLLPT